MRKIIITLIACVIGYSAYAWQFLANDPSRPVLSIVTEDSYRQIPGFVAMTYLKLTDYSIAKKKIEGSPAIPYLATGYGLGGFSNEDILVLIDRFLDKDADINASFQGYTALNGAILANSPVLVEHLLSKGASTSITVQRDGIKYCNGLASLDFAICINELGKQDLTNIIASLREKT